MKKVFLTAVLTLMTTSVFAGDLPLKSAPLPPVRPFDLVEPSKDFYIGVNGGGTFKSQNYVIGATAGTKVLDPIWAEVTYDYTNPVKNRFQKGNHQMAINALAFYPSDGLRVYGLAGVGYSWGLDKTVWNVGAGIRVPLADGFELDGRYRFS